MNGSTRCLSMGSSSIAWVRANMHLARYPIHWHLIGDAQGQYIRNSAIHDTYSRCVTVHGTNYLDIENNVTYNNIGHCFFLEDAVEHGNQFVHNLGILTKCHPDAPCVPTRLAAAGRDPTGGREWPECQGYPASLGQHGVDFLDHQSGQYLPGQRGRGFRLERLLDFIAGAPDRVSSKARRSSAKTWPRRTPFREFKGNVAPLQLRLVHVRPKCWARWPLRCYR